MKAQNTESSFRKETDYRKVQDRAPDLKVIASPTDPYVQAPNLVGQADKQAAALSHLMDSINNGVNTYTTDAKARDEKIRKLNTAQGKADKIAGVTQTDFIGLANHGQGYIEGQKLAEGEAGATNASNIFAQELEKASFFTDLPKEEAVKAKEELWKKTVGDSLGDGLSDDYTILGAADKLSVGKAAGDKLFMDKWYEATRQKSINDMSTVQSDTLATGVQNFNIPASKVKDALQDGIIGVDETTLGIPMTTNVSSALGKFEDEVIRYTDDTTIGYEKAKVMTDRIQEIMRTPGSDGKKWEDLTDKDGKPLFVERMQKVDKLIESGLKSKKTALSQELKRDTERKVAGYYAQFSAIKPGQGAAAQKALDSFNKDWESYDFDKEDVKAINTMAQHIMNGNGFALSTDTSLKLELEKARVFGSLNPKLISSNAGQMTEQDYEHYNTAYMEQRKAAKGDGAEKGWGNPKKVTEELYTAMMAKSFPTDALGMKLDPENKFLAAKMFFFTAWNDATKKNGGVEPDPLTFISTIQGAWEKQFPYRNSFGADKQGNMGLSNTPTPKQSTPAPKAEPRKVSVGKVFVYDPKTGEMVEKK